MGEQTFDIKQFEPLAGVPVVITTNWSTYTAALRPSVFGGYEFKVIGRRHTVQLTTVRRWRFTSAYD